MYIFKQLCPLFKFWTLVFSKLYENKKSKLLTTLMADWWGTEPGAWWHHHSDQPPLRPARSHTAAGSRYPTGGSSLGCLRPFPRREPLCWAGSRRRRSSGRLWSQPATRTAWRHPGGSRNLRREEEGGNAASASCTLAFRSNRGQRHRTFHW